MGVYFNLNLKKKKSEYSTDEEIPVNVYYYFDKRKLNVSTGVKTNLKDWNEKWKSTHSKNPIKKSDPSHKTKNLLIKNKVKEVEDIIHQLQLGGEIPTIDLVRSNLNQNERKRIKKSIENLHFLFILEEYRKWNDSMENTNRPGYKKSVRTCLKRIEDFTFEYQKKVGYKLLTTDIDNQYQYSLIKFLDNRGEQPSTIRKRLKILVNLINWSREEKGYTDHRIKVVKMRWDFRRDVIFLKRDELLRLIRFTEINRDNDNHTKHTEEYIQDKLKNNQTIEYTNLEVIRDMLVFGCGIGCRYSDLVKLRVGNRVFSDQNDRTQGFFRYRMTKSRTSKEVKVPLNNLTYQIFRKYSRNKTIDNFLFPQTRRGNPISNQKFNKHLKTIGFKVGLNRRVSNPKFDLEGKVLDGSDTPIPLHKMMTSHIMRRTFIREGLNSGVSPRVLMELSGHTTEKVFKRYFDTLTDEIDEEGKKMFSTFFPDSKEVDKSKRPKETEGHSKNGKTLEEKLKELKFLFQEGLIPEKVYQRKVSELIETL